MSENPNKGKQPSHDIIMLDDDGKFAKTDKEIEGEMRRVNHVVGAAWSDAVDASALLKFEDGSKAKMMPRSALKKHRDAKDGAAAQPAAPAPKPAAPAPGGPGKSRFSKPAGR